MERKLIKIEGILIEVSDNQIIFENELADELVGGKSESKFKDVLSLKDTISKTCLYLKDSVLDAGQPNELTIEFGVKFGGEGSIPFISKVTAESSLNIKATWKLEEE
jgi:hypothetical protein